MLPASTAATVFGFLCHYAVWHVLTFRQGMAVEEGHACKNPCMLSSFPTVLNKCRIALVHHCALMPQMRTGTLQDHSMRRAAGMSAVVPMPESSQHLLCSERVICGA